MSLTPCPPANSRIECETDTVYRNLRGWSRPHINPDGNFYYSSAPHSQHWHDTIFWRVTVLSHPLLCIFGSRRASLRLWLLLPRTCATSHHRVLIIVRFLVAFVDQRGTGHVCCTLHLSLSGKRPKQRVGGTKAKARSDNLKSFLNKHRRVPELIHSYLHIRSVNRVRRRKKKSQRVVISK